MSEAPSSSSVTVNPTENLRLTKEVGIQCELLVCENQVAMTSVAIQTAVLMSVIFPHQAPLLLLLTV